MQRVCCLDKKKKKGLLFMAKACSEFETTPISEDQTENEISEHAEAIDFLKKTMESVNKNLDQ